MTITEIRKLLALVKQGTIKASTIGLYAYFLTRQSDILTYVEMNQDVRLSPNHIRAHITAMEKLSIIRRVVHQKGIIVVVRPTTDWDTTTISNTTPITNSIHKRTMRKIVEDISSIALREYSLTNYKTKELILARLNEGYTLDDFKKVHQNMRDWLDSEKMAEYYRPSTLYQKSKFPTYLEKKAGTNRLQTTSKWKTPEAKAKLEKRKAELRREFGVTTTANEV